VSNEALCVINGITPIHIKVDERGRLNEITQGIGTQYDRDMELENWTNPATNIKTVEGKKNVYILFKLIQTVARVGAAVLIFLNNNI